MKKATDKEVLDAVKLHGANADAIAKELSLAKSNVFYRLRQLKAKGRLNVDGEVVEVSPTEFVSQAINKDDKDADNISEIVKCSVDEESLKVSVDKLYKKRKGIDDIIESLSTAKEPVCLIGDAGSGKTKLSEQLAARLGLPFVRVACDDTTLLKDMLGRTQIKNGTTFFRTGILAEMVQRPCVILFDEFNALPSGKLFFLHELLDTRRLLIKDGQGGQIINFHEECRILLACNFNNAKYSGTNKTNAALADRPCIVQIPPFKPTDVATLFDTGHEQTTKDLMKFYVDVNNTIKQQGLRCIFSLRGVNRIAKGIKRGDSVRSTLEYGLFNHALLTASENEQKSLVQIARVVFGNDVLSGKLKLSATPNATPKVPTDGGETNGKS